MPRAVVCVVAALLAMGAFHALWLSTQPPAAEMADARPLVKPGEASETGSLPAASRDGRGSPDLERPELDSSRSVARARWIEAVAIETPADASAVAAELRRSADDVEADLLITAASDAGTTLVRATAIHDLVRRAGLATESEADIARAGLLTLFDEGDTIARRSILASLTAIGTPRHVPLLDALRDRVGDEHADETMTVLYENARAAAIGRTK